MRDRSPSPAPLLFIWYLLENFLKYILEYNVEEDFKMTSIYHLYCCCSICKKELTVQNLERHYQKHIEDQKPKAYCKQCKKPVYVNHP